MTNTTLNLLLPEFDGDIIDIKIDVKSTATIKTTDEIVWQMNNIISSYNKGQTSPYADY